uniref:Uncharacterized protein n=1 Tax=Pyxicephalus adspersus TaxID=30357 RepID=A0AAV3B737_PYXAD|nr:TPA: hypothetical protein GDO54_007719 [Pyxicephalus adspersus]
MKVLWVLLISLILPTVTGMTLPAGIAVTTPYEMITSDSQVPKRIKGNMKKSWELQRPKLLVQKGRGQRRPRSLSTINPHYLMESTAFFFVYDDTDTERLAQISRFIGEPPKQTLKVPLNFIIGMIHLGFVVLFILILIYSIICFRGV